LEEAIADAYKHWKNVHEFEVPPEVHGIFEKMKAFFEAIKERIGKLLGKKRLPKISSRWWIPAK
jgi:hypothetical protein